MTTGELVQGQCPGCGQLLALQASDWEQYFCCPGCSCQASAAEFVNERNANAAQDADTGAEHGLEEEADLPGLSEATQQAAFEQFLDEAATAAPPVTQAPFQHDPGNVPSRLAEPTSQEPWDERTALGPPLGAVKEPAVAAPEAWQGADVHEATPTISLGERTFSVQAQLIQDQAAGAFAVLESAAPAAAFSVVDPASRATISARSGGTVEMRIGLEHASEGPPEAPVPLAPEEQTGEYAAVAEGALPGEYPMAAARGGPDPAWGATLEVRVGARAHGGVGGSEGLEAQGVRLPRPPGRVAMKTLVGITPDDAIGDDAVGDEGVVVDDLGPMQALEPGGPVAPAYAADSAPIAPFSGAAAAMPEARAFAPAVASLAPEPTPRPPMGQRPPAPGDWQQLSPGSPAPSGPAATGLPASYALPPGHSIAAFAGSTLPASGAPVQSTLVAAQHAGPVEVVPGMRSPLDSVPGRGGTPHAGLAMGGASFGSPAIDYSLDTAQEFANDVRGAGNETRNIAVLLILLAAIVSALVVYAV